jgi:hypothetical protein
MPIGILIIIKMLLPSFFTADELAARIEAYFTYIEGEFYFEEKPEEVKGKADGAKIWDREPEPATITGLALFVGFSSCKAFDDYQENGEFATILQRGRLSIEAAYEKKLHQQSPAGAIFALKCLGWSDKPENKPGTSEVCKILEMKITETGPKPVDSEKEVIL